ncbi:Uncharacterized protein Fot_35648 [Forsythia ovata]|uniref:Uncharacterized protein n=1 Tax=Forsythia ovata TaxID=205694 RepID=A0ABD1SM47_9LAMI
MSGDDSTNKDSSDNDFLSMDDFDATVEDILDADIDAFMGELREKLFKKSNVVESDVQIVSLSNVGLSKTKIVEVDLDTTNAQIIPTRGFSRNSRFSIYAFKE